MRMVVDAAAVSERHHVMLRRSTHLKRRLYNIAAVVSLLLCMMTVALWAQSLSPGNEQADFWGSEAARTPGSRNLAGISDPVVDELIAQIIAAPDRAGLVARTRALDRVLLFGYYIVPQFHLTAFRTVYWNRFARPATAPKYELGFDTWWIN